MPSSAKKKRNRYKLGRERDIRGKTKPRPQIKPDLHAAAPEVKGAIPNDSETLDISGEANYPYKDGNLLTLDFYPEPSQLCHDKSANGHTTRNNTGRPIQLTVKVIKTFSTTLSCALLISIPLKQLQSASIPVDSAILSLLGKKHSSHPKSSSRTSDSSKLSNVLFVLKLCDRRFSRGVREDYDAEPWSPEIEKEFEEFEALEEEDKPEVSIEEGNDSWHYEMATGSDTKSNGDIHNEPPIPSAKSKSKSSARRRLRSSTLNGKRERMRIVPDKWSKGHREAYMQKKCDRHCEVEVSIYRHLHSLQGKQIPALYGKVQFPSHGGSKEKSGKLSVGGMLLEYIHPSFSLRNVLDHVSEPKKWQEIGETAIKIVQVVGDRGVLNQDVRLDNVLMIPIEEGYQEERHSSEEDDEDEHEPFNDTQNGLKFFRAVMIDFGLARLRREDETDEAWRQARRQQDEEGAIGYVFEKHLWKAVTAKLQAEPTEKPFKYRPSGRLLRSWDNEEEDM